jgi:hypothetical protein
MSAGVYLKFETSKNCAGLSFPQSVGLAYDKNINVRTFALYRNTVKYNS